MEGSISILIKSEQIKLKLKFKIYKIKIISDFYDFYDILYFLYIFLYIISNLRTNDKACLDIFR